MKAVKPVPLVLMGRIPCDCLNCRHIGRVPYSVSPDKINPLLNTGFITVGTIAIFRSRGRRETMQGPKPAPLVLTANTVPQPDLL